MSDFQDRHGLVELTGRPKISGDYWVGHGEGRFSVLHIPEHYKDEHPLPVLCLLHGAHEDDPDDPVKWALHKTMMNQYADRYNFIVVYPIAQPLYSLSGKWFYAWNSKLGTLREFSNEFQDDQDFIAEVHHWVLENTTADKNNFSLGGFSEGALMAANIAQAGTIDPPSNCLILVAGTMLEGQQHRHPGDNTPRNVLIQVNMLDTILPPESLDDSVARGDRNSYAVSIGYVNMDKSRPLLQEQFWLDELSGGGSYEHDSSTNDVCQRDIYSVQRSDWARNLTVYRVNGNHAWHGNPEGDSTLKSLMPSLDFPLSDIIAQYIMAHRDSPGVK